MMSEHKIGMLCDRLERRMRLRARAEQQIRYKPDRKAAAIESIWSRVVAVIGIWTKCDLEVW